MQHPEEGTIHAWLDGELSAEDSSALEAHAAACAECSAKVAEARGLIAASSRIVSALDIVPGGVIPAAKPVRRPWYASTQLRAAAAVLIVAGASALVMRNGGQRAMENAVTVSAPLTENAATAPPVVSDPSVMVAASPAEKQARDEARNTAPAATSQSVQSLKREAPPAALNAAPMSDARIESDFSRARESAGNATAGSVSGASAPSAPVNAPPPPMPMIALRRGADTELKKIRSDSAGTVMNTVFMTADSAEVTLTDISPAEVRSQRVTQSKVLDAPSAVKVNEPAAPAAKAKPEAQREVFTITWTDKRGHTMTLRGPVSLTILEQIRRSLPENQR